MNTTLDARLRINEIFYSLQGESTRAGLPTVFVRLTGCPLRCDWCDTDYAFSEGEALSLSDVLDRVARYGAHYVCVTGGEPLAQKSCLPLLAALAELGYAVSLETSGALDVSAVDPRISKVMDLKAPDSGEAERNRWANLSLLRPHDELKLVLASTRDYEWACQVLRERRLDSICPVLFSPVAGRLEPRQLAEWILRDRLPVRMQIQLHKVIWGAERAR